MSTDLNIAPYFDDFTESKNYHQVLFRPGTAVQARELTELQSILRNQIEKFGNHIFKQGSVVIPGNSNADLGVTYITIQTEQIDSLLVGRTIVGAVSGIRAIIRKVVPATETDAITVYVSYISGGLSNDGVTPNGNILFQANEELRFDDSLSFTATVIASGIGSLAYINAGVYYVNGTFVSIAAQDVVIDKYGIRPNCHVLLKIIEKIVSADDDSQLFDPAYGSYNFAAPGADRLKISLELTVLPYGSSITDNYIEIMRYKDGTLEEHARYPKYNELEKSLARRTYDESGDYVVFGLRGKVREHFKEGNNGGLTVDGDRDNYCVTVSPGKAYINGFEVEKLPYVNLVQPKARTPDHAKSKSVSFRVDYGRYILITDAVGVLSFKQKQQITFYSGTVITPGDAIATARVFAIDVLDDAPLTNPIYKVWITDISATGSSFSLESAGSIFTSAFSASLVQELTVPLTSGTFIVGETITYNTNMRGAIVCYWSYLNAKLYAKKATIDGQTKQFPIAGDTIVGAYASAAITGKKAYFGTSDNIALIPLPVEYVASIETQYNSNIYDFEYVVHAEFTINTDASGNGVSNTTNGIIRSIDAGSFAIITRSGMVVPRSLFSITSDNKSISVSGGPGNDVIKIYTVVAKNAGNSAIKTKTLIETTEYGLLFDSTGNLQLSKADVYSVVSIRFGSTGEIPVSNVTLNVNQTDYAYNNSSLTLHGMAIPSDSVNVTYKYFAHSAGDFFCIDSYKNNDNYDELFLYYMSTTGKSYNLKNCIDFRSTVDSSNSFGPTANVSDPFVTGEIFSTPVQYWVPRYDLLVIDKKADIYIIQGTPNDIPQVPNTPTECLALEKYFVPAYTERISDIKTTRLSVDRFTMQDISNLATRIEHLEEFSTLLAAEMNAIQYDVVDEESGLSRFKTGYLVETFKTPLVIANTLDPDFHATFYDSALKPAVEEMQCPVSVIGSEDSVFASSGYANTNGLVTLPYTETTLISQPLSSRVTNLNPFLVIKWDGILSVTPQNDYWIEQLDLPVITNTQTEIVTITRWVEFPSGPTVHEDIRTGTTVMPVTTAPFIRTVFV